MRCTRLLLLAVGIFGASCGGGGSDAVKDRVAQIAELTAKADAAETLARSLAQDMPCVSNDKCSVLAFASTTAGCTKSALPFSLDSSTANAARDATTQQNSFARQSADLQPSTGACIQSLPVAQCVANRCTTGT